MANDRAPLQEIIRRKRDGRHLTRREIQRFIDAVSTGAASEGQIGAFAMAVLLNGMGVEECADLTLSMRDSGEVIDWSHLGLPGPVVDKHSTGGVGDTVSLMLAPMLAACGTFVPMISGRGLGHTGGTLDKLSAIPGYDTKPDIKRFQEVVASAGCAIIGQTASLAPADGRIYSVRDVTATVESIPLITASILSKKLAAGLDALVMDIKLGNGAFMTDLDQAIALAQSIGQVSKEAGLKVCSLITDMNEPLARPLAMFWRFAKRLTISAAGFVTPVCMKWSFSSARCCWCNRVHLKQKSLRQLACRRRWIRARLKGVLMQWLSSSAAQGIFAITPSNTLRALPP